MLYLGIDPGAAGGLAVLTEHGEPQRVEKLPPTDAELLMLLEAISEGGTRKLRAAVEYVSASPKMGVVSAFTFGKGYGALLMALHAAGIPFDLVTPRRWQGALSCLSGGDKNVTKRRAQQLFPGVKVTHAIADALLMAEYCRRLERGSIQPTRERMEWLHGKKQAEEIRKPRKTWAGAAPEEKGPGDVQGRTLSGGQRAGKGAAFADAAGHEPGPRRAPRHHL